MSFDEPRISHRDSWPPTIIRLNGADLPDLDDIDSNPFAHFLATPDINDDDIEDLSAGIESDDDVLPEIRDVSPSSLQRDSSDADDDSPVVDDTCQDCGPLLSLKDFTDSQITDAREKASHKETATDAHQRLITVRGRATVRTENSRSRQGRGRPRSLSSQSSHSWREPSADVWSIPEEKEDVEDDIAPVVADWEKYQGNLEGKLDENLDILLPPKKPKKKVRWALP